VVECKMRGKLPLFVLYLVLIAVEKKAIIGKKGF
jgi:hypothetical protein